MSDDKPIARTASSKDSDPAGLDAQEVQNDIRRSLRVHTIKNLFKFLGCLAASVGAAALLFVVVMVIAINSLNMAGETLIRAELSPDRRHKALIFEGNGGATTGFWSNVAVVDVAVDPSKVPVEAYVFGMDDRPEDNQIQAKWTDSRTLVITYRRGSKTETSKTVLGDINIRYKELGGASSTGSAIRSEEKPE